MYMVALCRQAIRNHGIYNQGSQTLNDHVVVMIATGDIILVWRWRAEATLHRRT